MPHGWPTPFVHFTLWSVELYHTNDARKGSADRDFKMPLGQSVRSLVGLPVRTEDRDVGRDPY